MELILQRVGGEFGKKEKAASVLAEASTETAV
jgi:hypothetical protein